MLLLECNNRIDERVQVNSRHGKPLTTGAMLAWRIGRRHRAEARFVKLDPDLGLRL